MSVFHRVAPYAAPFLALTTAAACLSVGLGVAAMSVASRAPAMEADPCALPRGIDFGALGERDRSFALRRAVACSDYEHRRITPAEYRERLKALDALPQPIAQPVATPVIEWATMVREVSTQYTDSQWAGERALGAPDVYPGSGDNANAWASRDADGQTEFLEVGYDQARRVNGVEIYETYNPGAVTNVEVITADGKRRSVYQGAAKAMNRPSFRHRIDFACTAEPIVAVRVTLDSKAVPGWNEIDAVGVSPCDSP